MLNKETNQKSEKKSAILNMMVEEEFKRRLERGAKDDKRSLTNFIEVGMTDYMDTKGVK